MALQVNLASTSFGVPAPAAYVRVADAMMDKFMVHVSVLVYFDAASRENDKQPLDQKRYALPVGELTGDIFPAIYSALKALPEYAGAVDC